MAAGLVLMLIFATGPRLLSNSEFPGKARLTTEAERLALAAEQFAERHHGLYPPSTDCGCGDDPLWVLRDFHRMLRNPCTGQDSEPSNSMLPGTLSYTSIGDSAFVIRAFGSHGQVFLTINSRSSQ